LGEMADVGRMSLSVDLYWLLRRRGCGRTKLALSVVCPWRYLNNELSASLHLRALHGRGRRRSPGDSTSHMKIHGLGKVRRGVAEVREKISRESFSSFMSYTAQRWGCTDLKPTPECSRTRLPAPQFRETSKRGNLNSFAPCTHLEPTDVSFTVAPNNTQRTSRI
jgi:hypothetical protein